MWLQHLEPKWFYEKRKATPHWPTDGKSKIFVSFIDPEADEGDVDKVKDFELLLVDGPLFILKSDYSFPEKLNRREDLPCEDDFWLVAIHWEDCKEIIVVHMD